MDEIIDELEPIVKKLSLYYSKRFKLQSEDLYQDGMLALLLSFGNYRHLREGELKIVLKKIINRKIYETVKRELFIRTHEVSLEEIDGES
ncbi:MAG: hypothetical protein K6343_02195 [Caldisericaceae bacterium]